MSQLEVVPLKQYFLRTVNVGLRAGTLASKFILVFFLAKYFKPGDLGLYGLIVTTVAYALYPLGVEFYTYSSREILKKDCSSKGGLLKNQAVLHLHIYIFIVPLFFSLFYFHLLPWSVAPFFFSLLIVEHVNQEMSRLLIVMEMQLTASITLFFRHGLWALILIVLMYFEPKARSIEVLLIGWLLGGSIALFVAAYSIWNLRLAGWHHPTDWAWIKRGVKIALPMFLGSLCLGFIFTVDKYWFKDLQGLEMLGVYVFYMTLSTSLISFLDAGVYSFMYPSMIVAHNQNDHGKFSQTVKMMLIQVLVCSIFFVMCVCLSLGYVLDVIGKQIYLEYEAMMFFFLLTFFFQALSYIPHYVLYSQGKDKFLIFAHIMCVPFFVLNGLVFVEINSVYGIPVALCITMAFSLCCKLYFCFRNTPGALLAGVRS